MTVTGELTWSPPPSPWLVWPAYAALLLLGAAAGLLARTPRPLGALLLVGGAAALWHAVSTPEPAASLSSHTGAIVAALLPALVAVLVAAIGFRAALRGRGAMAGLLAVVLGWLLLVQGLPDVDVLWSAHVLSNLGRSCPPASPWPCWWPSAPAWSWARIAAVRRFREVTAAGRDADPPVPVG